MNKARIIVLLSFFSLILGIFLTSVSYKQLLGYKTKAADPPNTAAEQEIINKLNGNGDTSKTIEQKLAVKAGDCRGTNCDVKAGAEAGNAAAALEKMAKEGKTNAIEAAKTAIMDNYGDNLLNYNPDTKKYEFIDQPSDEERKSLQKEITNQQKQGANPNPAQTTRVRGNVKVTCDDSLIELLKDCKIKAKYDCCCGMADGIMTCVPK